MSFAPIWADAMSVFVAKNIYINKVEKIIFDSFFGQRREREFQREWKSENGKTEKSGTKMQT